MLHVLSPHPQMYKHHLPRRHRKRQPRQIERQQDKRHLYIEDNSSDTASSRTLYPASEPLRNKVLSGFRHTSIVTKQTAVQSDTYLRVLLSGGVMNRGCGIESHRETSWLNMDRQDAMIDEATPLQNLICGGKRLVCVTTTTVLLLSLSGGSSNLK
jgi:hypothetical protein